MLRLATEVRLAPWQIRDLQEHYKINLASLSFLFVLFAIVRYFTSLGNATSLLASGALYGVAIIALFVLGFIVRYWNASEAESLKLTNRWSTFFIVSFGYCLLILCFALGVQEIVFALGGRNVFLWFNDKFPLEWQGLIVLSFIVSAIATLLLWGRTQRTFADFRSTKGWRLVGVLGLALVSVGTIFWLAIFTL
jgi:hypothetical protein